MAGSKRTSKTGRKNLAQLPKPSIRRIAIRGGARRIQAKGTTELPGVYDTFRKALNEQYLDKVVNDAAKLAEISGRKTVLARDIVNALSARGQSAY